MKRGRKIKKKIGKDVVSRSIDEGKTDKDVRQI